MSDNFARKIRRKHALAAVLATARAGGCTCTPDVTLPTIERGRVRVATVRHDDDCPHARDADTSPLVERINAGEFDRAQA